jgi:uncharacterized protein (DUF58 family)
MRSLGLILLVLLVIAVALRADAFVVVAYLLLAAYLLSDWWTRHIVSRLEVQREFADRAFRGDRVAVELAVTNGSWLPVPWLEIGESLPAGLASPPFRRIAVGIGPRGRRHLRYVLACQRRGYYRIGPAALRTGGLLGMRPVTGKVDPADHLVVYPEVLSLQRLGLPTRSPLAVSAARASLFEDPSRVMGVRDYQVGDSPRRMHWMATAREGKLLVRRYQPGTARDTVICLDLNRDSYTLRHRYDSTELAIVAAASVANHAATEERLPVGLLTEAFDPELGENGRFFLLPATGQSHLMRLMEVLARVQISQATPLHELLRRESVRMGWGSTLMVITGRESEALLEALVALRKAGFAVALLLVGPGRTPTPLRERAMAAGLSVHTVWRKRDLESW